MAKKGGKKGGGKAKVAKKAAKVGRQRGQMLAGGEGVGISSGPRGRRGRRIRQQQMDMKKAHDDALEQAAEQRKLEEKRKAMGSKTSLQKMPQREAASKKKKKDEEDDDEGSANPSGLPAEEKLEILVFLWKKFFWN